MTWILFLRDNISHSCFSLVSKRESDCYLISNEQFSAMSWTKQDTFNEMKLDFDIVDHWNNSTRVDMSFHSIPIPSQPIFAFKPYSCVLSGEANNTNFIVFGLTRPGLETTIYLTRGERGNNNAIDAVLVFLKMPVWFPSCYI